MAPVPSTLQISATRSETEKAARNAGVATCVDAPSGPVERCSNSSLVSDTITAQVQALGVKDSDVVLRQIVEEEAVSQKWIGAAARQP